MDGRGAPLRAALRRTLRFLSSCPADRVSPFELGVVPPFFADWSPSARVEGRLRPEGGRRACPRVVQAAPHRRRYPDEVKTATATRIRQGEASRAQRGRAMCRMDQRVPSRRHPPRAREVAAGGEHPRDLHGRAEEPVDVGGLPCRHSGIRPLTVRCASGRRCTRRS